MADKQYFFRRSLGSLRPDDAEAEEALRGVGANEIVGVIMRRPRNVGHHRKFFALLKIVFENQEIYRSEAELLAAIKIATGHCVPLTLTTGQKAFIPSSISFASMDQAEFDKFWNAVCVLVTTKIIPNLSRDDLEAELMSMVS
jgi:hypothetical protein